MTTTETFTSQYLAARIAKHSATNLTEQFAAEKTAAAIGRKAERAGIYLDVITLDDQALAIVKAG